MNKDKLNYPADSPIRANSMKIAIHDCYCGKIKEGDKYDSDLCDLGCQYPGA